MRNRYVKQNYAKTIFYAVVLALVLAVIVISLQDIQIPTEHVQQEISVNLKD